MTTAPEGIATATPSPPPRINVYLLMESRLPREALARILRRSPDVTIVGAGEGGGLERSVITASECDVLVMDTAHPERLRGLLQTDPSPPWTRKVLLIGMDRDSDQFLGAIRTGVAGYLLKDASASEIVTAIRALARGEAHCPPQLCLDLFKYIAHQPYPVHSFSLPAAPTLTLRQQKLVQLVAEGFTNKEIASHLHLSEFTVRNHIHRILRRLKVPTRRELVEVVRLPQRQLPPFASVRGGVRSEDTDAEIYSLDPQPRLTGFAAVRGSATLSLQVVGGSRSEKRHYSGESR